MTVLLYGIQFSECVWISNVPNLVAKLPTSMLYHKIQHSFAEETILIAYFVQHINATTAANCTAIKPTMTPGPAGESNSSDPIY